MPPDLGFRKTARKEQFFGRINIVGNTEFHIPRIGAIPGDGMGLRQNGFSLLSLGSSEMSSLALLVKAAFFFFLLGEFLRLDLKLLFLGTLTIQDGGTINWKKEK